MARAAERATGAPLYRHVRSRTSTVSVIAARAGYPTATICSWDQIEALSNYHLMSDTPKNLDYGTVERAVRIAEAVVRELETTPQQSPADTGARGVTGLPP